MKMHDGLLLLLSCFQGYLKVTEEKSSGEGEPAIQGARISRKVAKITAKGAKKVRIQSREIRLIQFSSSESGT
jgi:hypothetical protein